MALNFSKSTKRDSWQVIANSIGVFLLGLLNLIVNNYDLTVIFTSLSIAAFTYLAVMNADTWATELGILSKDKVYYIFDLKRKVPAGTSGGISVVGTLSGFAGAFLISLSVIICISIDLIINIKLIDFNILIYSFLVIFFAGFL